MKILTTLFLNCPIKSCRSSPSSYPLNFKSCTLEKIPVDYNPLLLRNLLPRLNLDALETIVMQLGLKALVPERGMLEEISEIAMGKSNMGKVAEVDDQDEENERESGEEGDEEMRDTEPQTRLEGQSGQKEDEQEEALKRLHTLLVETTIQEGHLVCGNCGFEYPVKEGVGNFLLPGHLV